MRFITVTPFQPKEENNKQNEKETLGDALYKYTLVHIYNLQYLFKNIIDKYNASKGFTQVNGK